MGRTNRELANAIYSACYGHLDDKQFRSYATNAIIDWLSDGETVTTETTAQLAEEWREYITDANADDELALNLR